MEILLWNNPDSEKQALLPGFSHENLGERINMVVLICLEINYNMYISWYTY